MGEEERTRVVVVEVVVEESHGEGEKDVKAGHAYQAWGT